jgi:uncharacterized membrane protein
VIFSLAAKEAKEVKEVKEVKRAKAGFIVSLIGGIIILICDIYTYWLVKVSEVGAAFEIIGFGEIFTTWFAIGLIFAILVLVGAALIWTGKTTAGGIVAILFSIFSLPTPAFGGFVLGMILGIVGGALGIAKK